MADEPRPDLNEQEQEFRIRKLELETKMLAYQSQPKHLRLVRIQTAASLASFITAGVAVIALCASSLQWFASQRQARADKINERLSATLTQLASANPTARLTAAVALRSFFQEPNVELHSQVLRAYTSMLAIEDSADVRSAIVSSLGSIDTKSVSLAARQAALDELISGNRVMNKEGDLWSIMEPKESEANKKESRARAKSIASAITVLLRSGCSTRDLSSLYLADADFHGMNLSGVRFDRATLSSANFSDSVLTDASFNNSDLRWARFTKAKLQNAKLTDIEPDEESSWMVEAMERELYDLETDSKDQSVFVPLPDFSQADLTNADFTGFGIFPIECNDSAIHLAVVGPIFDGANLSGTNFSKANLFGFGPPNRCFLDPLGQPGYVANISTKGGLEVFMTGLPEESASGSDKKQREPIPANWNNWAVKYLFHGADTTAAKFDERFLNWAKFGERSK